VQRVGCAIGAQSARLVPADKIFYALRDRTATVPSPGLIAASIVAKKIAGGAHGIVFDVKCGDGAFVREPAAALQLARRLVALARGFGRRAGAVVSDMNQPLGPAIGTGLELCEARDFLRGSRRDPRLLALCETLAAAMLDASDAAEARADRSVPIRAALASGRAYEIFERMLVAQGAGPNALAALAAHPVSTAVRAPRSGYLTRIAPVALGEYARDLVEERGPTAGIVMRARPGDAVRAGDPLATVYGGGADPASALLQCLSIGDAPLEANPLVYGEIDARSGSA